MTRFKISLDFYGLVRFPPRKNVCNSPSPSLTGHTFHLLSVQIRKRKGEISCYCRSVILPGRMKSL